MLIALSPGEIWFSQRERRWAVDEKRKFSWSEEKDIWDWDSCTISLARTLTDKKLLVVVRSSTSKNSRYMGNKPVELRFMLGVEVNRISEPWTESYTARKNVPNKKEGPNKRWVFQLDNDYWIWEWVKEGGDIGSSNTYRLYRLINEEILHPNLKLSHNIFDVEVEGQEGDRVIPVIYQPAVDALDNFVREVHCAKKSAKADGSYEVEVSIIFNNEQLREHAYANRIYEFMRLLLYGRTLDIETFKILAFKDPFTSKFIFESIYSRDENGEHQLEDDSIHGDKPPAPEHNVKYYFTNHDYPVVFINTSNHAMAEHDTNHRIWKWEYIPWLENAPIKLGTNTRQEINKKFKPIVRFR